MNLNWKGALTAAMLATSFAGAPVTAEAADATFYELTENMTLDHLLKPTVRTATAALQGTARVGSPLCPDVLIDVLMANGLLQKMPRTCTVTAIGNDKINLATGAGDVWGTFAVLVNADNATDPAELAVMTGSFKGTMQLQVDMRTVPPTPLPLLTITDGTFTPEEVLGYPAAAFGIGETTFGGVFRLPFVVERGKKSRVWSKFALLNTYYLGDNGSLIRVRANELSLGMPTVRLEVSFP